LERKLFLCNTVYQLFVAMWMKHSLFSDSHTDIIISNHINNGKELADRVRKYGEFENCYFAESFDYSWHKMTISKKKWYTIHLHPDRFLSRLIHLEHTYSSVYVANFDPFSQLLYGALIQKYNNCQIYLYEDGVGTYNPEFSVRYEETKFAETGYIQKVFRKIRKQNAIYGNLSGVYLFTPEYMRWNPNAPLIRISKMDQNDDAYLNMCNMVYGYYDSNDRYREKYIFLEQCFEADGIYINDVDIIDQFAERVGKENIMVKIHPRNTVNRFSERGYKTNTELSIPWEVVLLNQKDLSDKVLMTVSSGAVVSPYILFGINVRAYSIINLLTFSTTTPRYMIQSHHEIVTNMIKKYPESITACSSLDEII